MAAFVIAIGNFADQPNVVVLLATAVLVGMMSVMPLAAETGRHSSAVRTATTTDPAGASTQSIAHDASCDMPAAG